MERARRFPAIGGIAAWRTPILGTGLAIAASLMGEWSLIAAIAVVALIADVLERAVVLEVSSAGLTRAVAVGDALVGPAHVIAWGAVAEVTTCWLRPRDFTGLETVVVGRDGVRISFGSRMGLGAYRRLVAEIVHRAPQARRTGLTEELLAGG